MKNLSERPPKFCLTPELVALTLRPMPDPGPLPGISALTESEFDAIAATALSVAPPDGDIWLFAYGSLIWKPEFPVEEQRFARLTGWQRRFAMRVKRFRGTPEQPGLMMVLDRGGQCDGVIQRIARADARDRLQKLVRREMSSKPPTNQLAWVTVEAKGEIVPALAITANIEGANYVGELPMEETVRILATACGHWGSCAEYLMQTVESLEELGIHDAYLAELNGRVAELLLRRAD